eukprot:GHVU01024298.1.p1 GENE.GHVU01024298.1~~GHVU01024298.1.p1  ORF type:complete len:130 (+),score=7.24 GHVU01024298.1:1796-2185(+)
MLLMFSSAVVSADACCLVQAQVWTKRHSEPTLVEWNLTKWSSWFQLSNHSDPILSTRLRTDAQSNNLIITILQDLSLEQLVSSAEISNAFTDQQMITFFTTLPMKSSRQENGKRRPVLLHYAIDSLRLW